MEKLRSVSSWAVPVALYVFIAASFSYPYIAYWLFFAALACAFCAVRFSVRDSIFTAAFWNFASTPLTFGTSVLAFLLFLDNHVLRAVLLALALFFFAIYLHQLVQLHFHPSRYQPFSLEAMSSYLNLVSVFCISVIAYGLQVFVSTPLWILSVLLLLFFYIIMHQALWMAKVDRRDRIVYSVVLDIILVELFWVLAFLPINFYVHGAMLAVTYYVLWGILRAHVSGQLTRRLAMRYIAVGGALVLLVVLTGQWT